MGVKDSILNYGCDEIVKISCLLGPNHQHSLTAFCISLRVDKAESTMVHTCNSSARFSQSRSLRSLLRRLDETSDSQIPDRWPGETKTLGTTVWFGQNLVHAHRIITSGAAALGSCFVLVWTHQHGIARPAMNRSLLQWRTRRLL